MKATTIVEADLSLLQHRAAVLELSRDYARDPMGSGSDLPLAVQESLIDGLRAHPTTLILLAFDADRPVGIATCFFGFSTFAARRLINVHDLHVRAECRGKGIGRSLLEAVEAKARALGCCKLTLEVQEKNLVAQAVYRSFGFSDGGLFREKKLV